MKAVLAVLAALVPASAVADAPAHGAEGRDDRQEQHRRAAREVMR